MPVRVTGDVKEPMDRTVMVAVPFDPCGSIRAVGEMEIAKSRSAETTWMIKFT